MININGKIYSDYGSIPSSIIKYLYHNPVFEFHLRWENHKIFFWESHYFKMMSQLRMLRLNIPMNYTLDFFSNEINKLINNKSNSFIIHLKFLNETKPSYKNHELELILLITVEEVPSLRINDLNVINKISFFKDYNFTNQKLGSVSYLQRDIKRIAAIDAYENNYDDNIILNNQNDIIGSISGNILLLNKTKIISPPTNIGAESNVLINKFVEFIEKINEYKFSYESFGLFELQDSDELCVLSINRGLRPVANYKKKIFKIKVFKKLFNLFIDQYYL